MIATHQNTKSSSEIMSVKHLSSCLSLGVVFPLLWTGNTCDADAKDGTPMWQSPIQGCKVLLVKLLG